MKKKMQEILRIIGEVEAAVSGGEAALARDKLHLAVMSLREEYALELALQRIILQAKVVARCEEDVARVQAEAERELKEEVRNFKEVLHARYKRR